MKHFSPSRGLRAAGLLAVAAAALTACGGGTKTESSATSAGAPETSNAPVEVTEPPTPPGTTLALGERAVIHYDDGIDKGILALTVTAIEVGDQAGFERDFGEDAKTTTPYYLRYTLENLAGTDLGGKNGPKLAGLLADGTTTGVFITGDLEPGCTTRLSPADFNKPGAKYENCQLDAASTGDPVVAVKYSGGDYHDKPIIWRKPGS
ncbi:hypothetical protein [Amycolatopsis taiwanensis]|uniref:hypothetical protein n=1 Tax=Amycolatopsis taiwanensis TaxID=342230 RepID=UPI00048994F7|nr:hypothetical protein [Amycolatopsis taiwanensis]